MPIGPDNDDGASSLACFSATYAAARAKLHLAASALEESQNRFAEALAHHKRFHALREAYLLLSASGASTGAR